MLRVFVSALCLSLCAAAPAMAQRVAEFQVPMVLDETVVSLPLRLELQARNADAGPMAPRQITGLLSLAPLVSVLDDMANRLGGGTLAPAGSTLWAEGGALMAQVRFRYTPPEVSGAATEGSVLARFTPAVSGSTIVAVPGAIQLDLPDAILEAGGDATIIRQHVEALILTEIQSALSGLNVAEALPSWLPEVPVDLHSAVVVQMSGGPAVQIEGSIGTRRDPLVAPTAAREP